MRLSFKAMVLAWGLGACPAAAGPNANFTLPLHAMPSYSCGDPLPIDCRDSRPTTTIPAHAASTILLFIANHSEVMLVQAAVSWDRSWTLCCVDFECQPSQGHALVLDDITLSFATIVPCLTGPSLTILGTLSYETAEAGCLRFVEPSYSGGIYAEDCALHDDRISDLESPRLGRICVGQAGHDACDPLTPVTLTTWGAIKESYR